MNYNDKVLNFFKNPTKSGKVIKPEAVGEIENEISGSILKLYLRINENEIIEDAKFQVCGCTAEIAVAQAVCEMITNKNINDALQISSKQIKDFLNGLPDVKEICANQGENLIRSAVENYKKKQLRKK